MRDMFSMQSNNQNSMGIYLISGLPDELRCLRVISPSVNTSTMHSTNVEKHSHFSIVLFFLIFKNPTASGFYHNVKDT